MLYCFLQFEYLPPAPPIPMPPPFPPDNPPLPAEEMDLSSEEESEYESGDDEDKERWGADNHSCQRGLIPALKCSWDKELTFILFCIILLLPVKPLLLCYSEAIMVSVTQVAWRKMSLNTNWWTMSRHFSPYSLCLLYFRIVRLMGLVNQACKRPLRSKTASKRKKPKIKDLLYAPKPESQRYGKGTRACHNPYAQPILRQYS